MRGLDGIQSSLAETETLSLYINGLKRSSVSTESSERKSLGRVMESAGFAREGAKEEVLRAWYINGSIEEEDRRLPHCCEPAEFVPLHRLEELGILSWRLRTTAENYEDDEGLKKIQEARGYSHTYTFDLHPERFPDFENRTRAFFQEHVHPNEEASYCIDGSGYYDVRDENDRWIRIELKKGGMLLLPAGIYHRFALDTNNYIKAVLFFVGTPVSSFYKRPKEDLPARKEYLETLAKEKFGSHGVLKAT